jgi:pimeloyl-ACP methyl ester carboxylesterase
MISHVQAHIGSERDRAVLIGSSLGGLAACRVAERDARACALVLMAPAFRIVERWRQRLGEDKWREWKETGYCEVDDYANGGQARVGYGFVEDIEAVEAEGDGWPDVRVPTLVFHGVRDDAVDIRLSREWAHGKRHVRLVELDDGHDLGQSIERILMETTLFLAPQGLF